MSDEDPVAGEVWFAQAVWARAVEGSVPGIVARVWDGTGPPPGPLDRVRAVVCLPSDSALVDALPRMPRLALVQLLSAGYEQVVGRIPAGAVLCNARGVHGPAVAEWIVAALLAARRGFPRMLAAQERGRWQPFATPGLADAVVAIVGHGAIGEALARRLSGFEVEVLAFARTPRDGVAAVEDLARDLPRVDALVLLVPGSPENTGLVDAALLARMKDGALVVNAGRGTVVDTDALVAEVRAGRLHAALDVVDPEPLPPGHPLWTLPGVILSPHQAGNTDGARRRTLALVCAQLERLRAQGALENVVPA